MTSVCSRPAPLARLVVRKPLRFWPKARRKAKTRQGPSFAQQKFFAPCLTSPVLSECGGAKEGEGGRPKKEVLRNWFETAVQSAHIECWPVTIGGGGCLPWETALIAAAGRNRHVVTDGNDGRSRIGEMPRFGCDVPGSIAQGGRIFASDSTCA